MRTIRLVGLSAICWFLLSAQNPTGSAPLQVQYASRLKVSSPADLDRLLGAAFTEGTAHPAGISNCTQLLAQRGHAATSQKSEQETLTEHSTMAECVAMSELRRAVPARSSFVRNLPWNEHVLPLLPPQLAITVSGESERAAKAAAGRGQTWLNLDPSITARPKGPETIVVTGSGFREQLIFWGRGDFSGDGAEGLLVQSLDTLTEGTYRNTRLFVLTRRKPDGPLSLVRSPL